MAFVGYVRPYLTSIPMLIELQSRVVARVFSGKVSLPNPSEMSLVHAADKKRQATEFPCNTERIPFLVDPYDYSHELASIIGAVPDYFRIAWDDPFLLYCLVFDSFNQFAYRLNDADADKRRLARSVIKEYHDHKTSIKIRGFLHSYIRYYGINALLLLVFVALSIFVLKTVRQS